MKLVNFFEKKKIVVPVILKDFSYFHFTFTVELLHNYHFTSHSFWVSVYGCSYSFPSKYLPTSFAVYLKTEDGWCSEKKKKKKNSKANFCKAWFVYPRVDDGIHQLVYNTDY